MDHKADTSQVTWALLAEGVSAARLEAHRLRHHVARGLALVESSPAKEALYEAAGDIFSAIPKRLEHLERHLDRTNYALSKMGDSQLRDRLPLADRKEVDESVEQAASISGRMSDRVVARYLQADLTPPLGYPGGLCHVVDRIRQEVPNPRLRAELISDMEDDGHLDRSESLIYDRADMERGVGRFKQLSLTAHVQYRMDQRGITVPLLRRTLSNFLQAWSVEKSRKSHLWKRWEQDMAYGETIEWDDPKLNLFVAFRVQRDVVVVITTYWRGERDPGAGSCAE